MNPPQFIGPDRVANLECQLADLGNKSASLGRYIKMIEDDLDSVNDDLKNLKRLKAEIDSLLTK